MKKIIKEDITNIECYTKQDLMKVEYVKRYRIKKKLKSESIGTLYAEHIDLNKFLFYYLDTNGKLQSFYKVIETC